MGRQPDVVYGLMRTADAVSPLADRHVAASLALFVVTYFAVFGAGIYYLFWLANKAPGTLITGPTPGEPHRAAGITPVSAMRAADPEENA